LEKEKKADPYRSDIVVEQERLFQFLCDSGQVPYHCIDVEGRVIKVNSPLCEISGYREEEILGRLFIDFLPETQKEIFEDHFSALKEVHKKGSIELQMIKQDSTINRVGVNSVVSHDSDGHVQHIHSIFIDLTAQKKIEDLIAQSEKLSTIANLAAGIAHELNTPLSGIMQSCMLVEMLLDPSDRENRNQAEEFDVDLHAMSRYLKTKDLDYFLKGIRESALKASKIIHNLLAFSRPTEFEHELVYLPELLDAAIQLTLADYTLKKKYGVINTEFIKEYDTAVTYINCIGVEIEQVILNLFNNSIQAMSDANIANPQLIIRVEKKEQNVRIEIEDNGPGIPAKVREHIFDPFYTTKEPGQGTGLGLSISQTIICDKHNGRLWIDPDCRKGTKFLIELPLGDVFGDS